MSHYHPLSEEQAIRYAQALPGLFPDGSELVSREIGDGNLNLVFHITDRTSGRSVIMKQALPYAKVVGESWPLTLDRARIESEALRTQSSFCPDLVPTVYNYDPDLALTVMEDLSDHVIMRKGLIGGTEYPLFAGHIGRFLAQTLFGTSDLGMNQQEKKLLVGRFLNPELCKITEDLIFDHPYRNADSNDFDEAIRPDAEALWTDGELHLEVALLREKFLTQAQALLHGDLHTGSIFVTPVSTKVIDPEFAYFGPMGFDIGAVIANLLLSYVSQDGWIQDAGHRRDYREFLLHTVRDVWTTFAREFAALWDEKAIDPMAAAPGYKEHYLAQVLKDSIGFAGCKMVRRIVGLAHVADIRTIPDADVRARAERNALAVGKALIKRGRHAVSIDDAIEAAKVFV
ncbi:MAG: S-methyl-5-thioribose kinase [Paenibacillaceae bacterium]|nr:S-methyl-5-thioribose kinase [Paenibacillaceae bacterium]